MFRIYNVYVINVKVSADISNDIINNVNKKNILTKDIIKGAPSIKKEKMIGNVKLIF